jgi:dethiobiotin synthetase
VTPLKGLFVTGTDTNVGKTVVSAALMHRCRIDTAVRYWKPIQTGIEDSDDTADVARLGACDASEVVRWGIRLPRPVSPHLASRWSGGMIDIRSLVDFARQQPLDRAWIVEGAGGVLVPLNETETMADLMAALTLPVVVAARASLGTINHTLLTLDALRGRGVHVAGVVMVGDRNPDNREAIEHYGRIGVVGELPWLTPLTPPLLSEWSLSALDRAGRLSEHLR